MEHANIYGLKKAVLVVYMVPCLSYRRMPFPIGACEFGSVDLPGIMLLKCLSHVGDKKMITILSMFIITIAISSYIVSILGNYACNEYCGLPLLKIQMMKLPTYPRLGLT